MFTMRDIRQGLINTFAVALYHRFEQHFSKFFRVAVGDADISKVSRGAHEVAKTFAAIGLDPKGLPGWSVIDELRLIANCVKHAEGESCGKLRLNRRDLFVKPPWSGEADQDIHDSYVPPFIQEPLAGEGLYLTEKEFREKADAIKAFWSAFANELEGLRLR